MHEKRCFRTGARKNVAFALAQAFLLAPNKGLPLLISFYINKGKPLLIRVNPIYSTPVETLINKGKP